MPMDTLDCINAGVILRDRWMDNAALADQKLADPTLSDVEKAVQEKTKAIYKSVAHELASRLELEE